MKEVSKGFAEVEVVDAAVLTETEVPADVGALGGDDLKTQTHAAE